jgi:hypothetical protein
MRKLLAVLILLSVAVPALASWGVPMIVPWSDPGDGPRPPAPEDPGDGPIYQPDNPAPCPYEDLTMRDYAALINAWIRHLEENW